MSKQVAVIEQKGVLDKFAENHGMLANRVTNLLTKTCFKTKEQITQEQLEALIIICNHYNLDPLLKQIYAYPDKGAIVPVVGIDGWIRIVNSQPMFDGFEFKHSEEMIKWSGAKIECPVWVECTIYHKDRTHATTRRAYLKESYKAIYDGSPWNSHTISMLENKAYIKCARFAFGLSGIYDEDDALQIINDDKKEPVVSNKAKELNQRLTVDEPIEPQIVTDLTGFVEVEPEEDEFLEGLGEVENEKPSD